MDRGPAVPSRRGVEAEAPELVAFADGEMWLGSM